MFHLEPLTTEQQEALDRFIDATAAIGKFTPRVIMAMVDHVASKGTDHDDGSKIDIAVGDCLEVISDQYHGV